MKKLRCFLFVVLLSVLQTAFAQTKTITGKVLSEATNQPLQGVNVLSDKSKTGVTTAADGTFSIKVQNGGTTLIFSYVGYLTKTVLIESNTTFQVSLTVAPTSMDEVVVIGYGTQKRSSVTGSVSKYSNEKLDEAPVSRLDQALQGKIAGVQIQNLSSEAGADPKINIRGVGSINAGASPLVVVDGHPVPDGLQFVNMADVQSVEVLKDAASAAIYGSRGANGVIIITTKSGKAEKAKYSLKFSSGAKTQYELYPMMTTSEYTNMLYYEAALKAQDPSIPVPTGTAIIANNERAAYIVENTLMGGLATDWQAQALRNADVKNVQLGVSGGTRTVKYYISGAYQKDQGMMYHSEYEKFSVRSKLDITLNPKAKLSFNINPTYIKRERPSVNFIDFVRFQSFMPLYHTAATAAFVNQSSLWSNIKVGDFVQARHFNDRMYSGLMPDGTTYTSTANLSPFNTANNTPKSIMETRSIKTNDYRVLTSADFSYNIIKGLDFKTLASVYANYTSGLDFTKRNSNKDGDVSRGAYTSRLFVDLLSENTLNYVKEIGDHSFSALAGFTAQKTLIGNEQTVGLDYPSDNITTLSTALQIDQANTYNTKNQIGLLSYLGRVTYAYKSKYLVNASFRTDGSSYFGPGKKWGSFPSVSLGWVASKEKFLQDVNWVNNLKLRASYGVSGNNRIVDFAFTDLLYSANYPLGASSGTANAGFIPSREYLANPDITWEKTNQYNFGIDGTLFKNIISFSIDAYTSETQSLLLKQSTMSFTGVPQSWANIGKLKNTGIEFEITSNNIRKKDFRWSTTANISSNRNKILDLGEDDFFMNYGERTEVYFNNVGSPMIQFFGFKTDGVWLSQKQIDDARANGLKSSLSNLFVPGGLKLVDVNGDGTIDNDDRVVMGTPYPKFNWGITNNLTFKNLDLTFSFQGSQGGKLINGDPNYNETKRYNRNYNTNRWLSPMFPGDGKTPYSTVGFNWMLTDYVVEDASYYALREVVVGYSFKDVASKLKLGGLRGYFSAQNLYFHSAKGYRGINIESRFTGGAYSTPLADGYQRGSFPMPKTFLVGIDINF